MASAFILGNLAVNADEFYEKLAMGTMERSQVRARQNPMATLEFREGAVRASGFRSWCTRLYSWRRSDGWFGFGFCIGERS